MPRLPLFSLTCVLAVALAGCDRESAEPAQPQPAATSENAEQLSGKLDRSYAGETMPEATLTDPAGATLTFATFASLKGQPVLVNLWATWCVPCIAEMPLLDDLAAELDGSVRVITVSLDEEGAEKVAAFFSEHKFANLPQWMDPKSDLAFAYGGSTSLPLTVLYDAEGKEVWRVMGGYDWASAEAREQVAEATAT
jgi:thiol-disulfide isomerase/thioredoxin